MSRRSRGSVAHDGEPDAKRARRGVEEQWAPEAQSLLKRCLSHRQGYYFREPVDPVQLGILDYFDIISDPMDFGTIQTRLKTGFYGSQEEFAGDMRLVFSNAKTYNHEGDDVWKAANTLSRFFEENWAKAVATLNGEEVHAARDTLDEACQEHPTEPAGTTKKATPKATRNAAPFVKGDVKVGQKYIKPVQETGWKGGAIVLIKELQGHADAWPFMQASQGSDGHAQGRKNMDFPMIAERLATGQYIRGGRKDFLRDTRSIFINAMAQNDEESQLHAMATNMSALFELEWASLMLVLDRKDASKLVISEGGEGGGVNSVKWEPHAIEMLQRLQRHPKGAKLLSLFPPGEKASAKQKELYTDTCPETMDFAGIEDRLQSRSYAAPKDFNRHVWLVLNNAKLFFSTPDMRKAGKEELAKVAEEMLRDFDEDYAANKHNFEEAGGASNAMSVFACEPPLELPRKREPLPRIDLPWKGPCLDVIAGLRNSVEARASDAGAEADGGKAEVLAALQRTAERVEHGYYKHVAEFVRDCKRAFRAARRAAGERGGEGRQALKTEVRALLESELKKGLESVVTEMAAALERAMGTGNCGGEGEVGASRGRGTGGSALGRKESASVRAEPEEWVEEARALLCRVAQHPAAWWFKQLPKPWTPQLSRYASAVSFPVDLCTMHALLECGQYMSLSAVAGDLRRMLDNVDIAPEKNADQQFLANTLRMAFLSAPSLLDIKTLQKQRQLEKRNAEKNAAQDARAAAAAAAAENVYGKGGTELKQVENWKATCEKILRQLSSTPVAWVLQAEALPAETTPSQLNSPSGSPSKQQPWVAKPIPGLASILKRLEENEFSDPVQVLLEARHVLLSYTISAEPGSIPADKESSSGSASESKTAQKASQKEKVQAVAQSSNADSMEVDDETVVGGADNADGQGVGKDSDETEHEEEEEEEVSEYIADDDETIRNIAKQFGLTPEALNAYNKPYISGITVNSKLLRGTVVRIPPRHGMELLQSLPPPPPVKVDLSLSSLRRRAAERIMVDLESHFRFAFFKCSDSAAGGFTAAVDATLERMPIVKYRKSQRFYHCKMPSHLVHVGQLLQKMLQNPVWASLTERLDAEDPRSVPNPIDLALVRANLELGIYSSADQCAADIRLSLANARAVCRDLQCLSTKTDLQLLAFLQENFEREFLMGKMHAVAFGYGETRQELPLSTPNFLQLAKDLLDRVMDKEDAEPFLRPVRPIEDGCADYTDVIREPMDLGTIRDKLDEKNLGGYETLADVVADVVVVFSNATTYNGEKSQIYEDASEMLKAFQADLAETLEAVCSKGLQSLDAKDGDQKNNGESVDKEHDPAQPLGLQQERAEYLPPQVVAPMLQSKLEEWDRKQNWMDSFDEKRPLPTGWQVVYEQRTHKVYYWNKNPGSTPTSWDQPPAPAVAVPIPPVKRPLKPAPEHTERATASQGAIVTADQTSANIKLESTSATGDMASTAVSNGNIDSASANHDTGTQSAQDGAARANAAQAQCGVADVNINIESAVVANTADGSDKMHGQGAVKMQVEFTAGGADAALQEPREDCTVAPHDSPMTAKSGRAQPRVMASPYVGMYYCPIFCCWRALTSGDAAPAVKYYGK